MTASSMSRSAGLDALRAVACLLVVGFHAHTVAHVSFGPLDPVVDGGDQGVYIFFALSGYLLYRPFLAGRFDLRSYAIKRAARILPGYYVALVALTLLTRSSLPLEHPGPYLAIASSYELPLRSFLGSAWTLSAEVLFYVTLPVIAAAARGREAAVLGILALLSIATSIGLRLQGTDGAALLLASYPAVFYAFVPGMLLAVAQARRPAELAEFGRWPFLVAGVALIVAGTLLRQLPIAIGTGVGTPLVMAWVLDRRLPAARTLVFLGGASYAMYLWHKDLFIAFGVVGGLIAAIGAAASWALVERPILDWAHGVSGAWTTRSAAAGVGSP
jgi:peptidoglycan/LPS O-acetylase OafA/YrhL